MNIKTPLKMSLMVSLALLVTIIGLIFSVHKTNAEMNYTGIRLPYTAGKSYVVTGDRNTHVGSDRHAIDLGMYKKNVLAIHDGKVNRVYSDPLGGNTLILDHSDGYCSVYYHLNKFYVTKGMEITRGQTIAQSGNTGKKSTGGSLPYHLHVAVLQKKNGSCTQDNDYEVPMIFDEHPNGELTVGDSIISQNILEIPPSNENKRIGFIDIAGNLYVKEGGLDVAWVHQASKVVDFELEGNRIGIFSDRGSLRVKEGDLDAAWVHQGDEFVDFKLEGDRIAVLSWSGDLYVKEGNLDATWIHEESGVVDFELEGDRIGIFGSRGSLRVKEGDLDAAWVHQGDEFVDFELEGDRIATLRWSGSLDVKEGNLDATWVNEADGVVRYQLDGQRIAILNSGGSLNVKEGDLDAIWTLEALDVTGFALSNQEGMAYYRPSILINHQIGHTGSYFEVNILGYIPNFSTTIYANNTYLGDIPIDANGEARFLISTDLADEGIHEITVDLNYAVNTEFVINDSTPLHNPTGDFPTFTTPPGIAFWEHLFLPMIK